MGTREASKVADGSSSRSSYEVEKRPDHWKCCCTFQIGGRSRPFGRFRAISDLARNPIVSACKASEMFRPLTGLYGVAVGDVVRHAPGSGISSLKRNLSTEVGKLAGLCALRLVTGMLIE